MPLFRFLLYFVVGWLILRIVRSVMNIGRGTGPRGPRGRSPERTPGSGQPDNFSPDQIQDAEFEDLTPPRRVQPSRRIFVTTSLSSLLHLGDASSTLGGRAGPRGGSN